MATLIDVGLVKGLSAIFPFLLTTVVIFAILSYVKVFGDNKAIHFLIAFIFGLMVFLSPVVMETINLMTPWFVLLFFFFMFMLIAWKIFGATDADILNVIKTQGFVQTWIIALVLIVAIGSFSFVISQKGGFGARGDNVTVVEDGEEGQQVDFWATLFHPKILGLIFIMLLGFFTISRLSAE